MTSSRTNPEGRPAESEAAGSPAWELLLPAVSAPARTRGRSLQAALREAVRSGRLVPGTRLPSSRDLAADRGAVPARSGGVVPGTRLPSSRDLAADLGVSRGLVTEAYEQLTAEGYLRSGRGAGTWVSGSVRAARGEARDLAPRAPGTRVDFRPGTP